VEIGFFDSTFAGNEINTSTNNSDEWQESVPEQSSPLTPYDSIQRGHSWEIFDPYPSTSRNNVTGEYHFLERIIA